MFQDTGYHCHHVLVLIFQPFQMHVWPFLLITASAVILPGTVFDFEDSEPLPQSTDNDADLEDMNNAAQDSDVISSVSAYTAPQTSVSVPIPYPRSKRFEMEFADIIVEASAIDFQTLKASRRMRDRFQRGVVECLESLRLRADLFHARKCEVALVICKNIGQGSYRLRQLLNYLEDTRKIC
jgi:hypothetical protein